jgi:hypothetical protein
LHGAARNALPAVGLRPDDRRQPGTIQHGQWSDTHRLRCAHIEKARCRHGLEETSTATSLCRPRALAEPRLGEPRRSALSCRWSSSVVIQSISTATDAGTGVRSATADRRICQARNSWTIDRLRTRSAHLLLGTRAFRRRYQMAKPPDAAAKRMNSSTSAGATATMSFSIAPRSENSSSVNLGSAGIVTPVRPNSKCG